MPSSCADALSSRDKNGIYLLNAPHVGLKPFYAYCMQDPQNNGSAWTVFLNRQDGSVNFTRNYHAYVEGFGNLEGEYWLGLKYINALTTVTNQPQELWVHMENFKNQTANAKYRSFVLSDESNGYAISILGGYSGNAGDSLSYHQGKPFATYDKDAKSLSTPKCATRYGGGWWYGGTSCHERLVFNINMKISIK